MRQATSGLPAAVDPPGATTARVPARYALAVLLAVSLVAGSAGALRAQDLVIDSVLPAADTLVIANNPQVIGPYFVFCIDYENPPIQFLSRTGVIGWRDPAAGGAVVREDSTTSQEVSSACPTGWELGAATTQFARGRYRLWYEVRIVDGNNGVHTDSVSVDSVFIFDIGPTLGIAPPADSVLVTSTPSIAALDANTNLGPSQLVRLIHRFTPEGGGASTVYRVDSLYTNENGLAALDAIPLDQGDGEYVLVAETDSLPIADDPPDVDTPARDQVVRRLNQYGPGVTVILPAQDSTHSRQFEVHGASQPTARVTIDQCDGCDALGDTVVTDANGGWTFGAVDFPTAGANSIRIIAWDTVALNNSAGIPDTATVTFDVLQNQPPTVTMLEPGQDTVIAVGDSVRFLAGASDPDGDAVTVVWHFSAADTALAGTPPDSVVGADAGPVAFAPAGLFTATATARDPHGAAASTTARTINVVPRGPNVDVTTPGSQDRVDGHDVVFVIRARLTGDLRADVDGNGVVDDVDLQLVMAAFGELRAPAPGDADPRKRGGS